jgi:hypothetical protein
MRTSFSFLILSLLFSLSGCVFVGSSADAVPTAADRSALFPERSACDTVGPARLLDFFGRQLPDVSLDCSGPAAPSDVQVTIPGQPRTRLPLYPDGAGPAPIATYGGIAAECDKLMPGHTGCYSTNPADDPSWLRESLACGFPGRPALILACDASSCVSEIFDIACTSAYPDTAPGATFAADATHWNIGGAVNEGRDIESQAFHATYEYTGSLLVARSIVRQGRVPVLALGGMLLDANGLLRPDADTILSNAIAQFPDVFHAPRLQIEAVDEPFWNGDDPPSGAALSNAIAAIQTEIALIHARVPNAAVGVTVAPVWDTVPIMAPSVEALLPQLQWLATDVYTQSLDPASQAHALTLAAQFAGYMRAHHPAMPIWLIVQGFAPVNGPPPDQWGSDRIATFESFMRSMSAIGASQYSGVLVWGWSFVNELPPQYAGMHFPAQIRAFYRSATAPPD